MSDTLESRLNESFRDALVAYYLGEVVPNDPMLKRLGLDQRLKTANDLYEFFLLDNQVGNEVQSSHIASAISSLQQLINGTLLGMEPGYETLQPTDARFVEWRDRSSQYPIWAANMQLALYPEIYISPALRLKKSNYFAQLENDINQNRINIDTAQDAVKAYLASFEEVANLTIINGYIDSDRFAEGKYYFIGKSRAENIYYWRTVDMNERAYKEGTEGAKFDNPTPGAWSDWKRAEIGINANTLERTIRPVYFNNRLFVTWVDLIHVTEQVDVTLPTGTVKPGADGSVPISPPGDIAPLTVITPNVRLVLNISYKKYDDSWSAPQIYMDVTTPNVFARTGKAVNLERDLNSIAIFDVSASPESLFIAMYAGESLTLGDTDGSTSTYAFLHTAFIDKNFNTTPAFPVANYVEAVSGKADLGLEQPRVRKTCWAFALKNKGNFQFTWSLYIRLKSSLTTAPNGGDTWWNCLGHQNTITDMTGALQPVLNLNASSITLSTALNSDIRGDDYLEVLLTFRVERRSWALKLIVEPDYLTNPFATLKSGSTLSILTPESAVGKIHFTLVTSDAVDDNMFDFLLDENFQNYRISGTAQVKNIENGKCKPGIISALLYNQAHPGFIRSGVIIIEALTWSDRLDTTAEGQVLSAKDYTFAQWFSYPLDMNVPHNNSQKHLTARPPTSSITAPNRYETTITFDKSTLLPNLPQTQFISGSKKFYITHGICVNSVNPAVWIGNALKSTEIELEWATADGSDPVSPKINKRISAILGIAEYIDFSASSIRFSDNSTTDTRDPIRMNTLFARELINKANIALEALLSWDTQQLQEPPIDENDIPDLMDFKGANGLYFWELFLHLPFMISHRLNLEQRFTDAERWLGFIFDPGRKKTGSAPAYWNVRPLVELPDPDYFLRAPIDPDGIAASDPVRYQKAVYFHYIKNLIDRGDMAYRQLTPDSLGEAKLWYVRILDLLGPRPDVKLTSQWTPMALGDLAASTNPGLRAFEQQLVEQERQVRTSAAVNNGKATVSFSQPSLRLSTFGDDPTWSEEDSDHFILPMNSELVKYWDMLETRLYNLRHNLTLDGKPLSLPLFAAPLDPRALLAAYANGATDGGAGSLLAQETPHYRYPVMFARASAAVETLIQFGFTLLSVIERKEQGQLMELQQQQVWEFAQYAIDLQIEAQKIEVQTRKALEASKAVVDARARFYAQLAEENVSPGEVAAGRALLEARVAEGVGSTAYAAASALKVAPNHAGVHAGATGGFSVGIAVGGAVGGFRLEGVPEMVAVVAQASATLSASIGYALERTEGFRRRLQEWENARDQALLESEQITLQLAVHDAQTRATALQLRQAQEAKKQAETVYAFLNKRFTNSQLYQWLNGQFSTFYYQAYDASFSLCLAAQACWQYEIADYSTSFIQPAAWKDAWRGLAAGEALKINLLRMDAAYVTRNDRRMEIVKTVSVRQLPVATDEKPSINHGWNVVLESLLQKGIAEFEITKAMLDDDYSDHYLRRIKRISVSLPVTVGPYQDIRATLTQSYSAVQMSAQADGPLKENMRASQQIALSTGVDDDGLFVFNFDDERYLPFEGTGAISRWTLSFSNPASQRDMIDSITDIIVHMRYTAKSR
ncbi:Insecticidal toxin protein [Pseudomonas syringae pv. cilantro]|uniref:Insecticidal toxin protein n=2 Tax=Pseudomonas syringae group TaxID=136849 RepID=A0A0N1JNF6_PSESX|nr:MULTISPECIES: neuraminidase-like domain-containing protein [Pseudomonas syringae group]KPC28001.1 Insecticidal toxin protein [Pseudomonas syringae pv. cilantro]RMN14822.1 putative Insecticidal toxin protein [Pseudomonas syringae pv. coriandricola]